MGFPSARAVRHTPNRNTFIYLYFIHIDCSINDSPTHRAPPARPPPPRPRPRPPGARAKAVPRPRRAATSVDCLRRAGADTCGPLNTTATRRREITFGINLGFNARTRTWRFFLLGLPGTPGRWVVKSSFGARIRFFYHERKDFFLFFPTRLACDTAGNRTRVFRLSIHPN